MNLFFEKNAIQNPILGAEAIWTATKACYKKSSQINGLPFAASFVILPLALHSRTAETLATKNLQGALIKSLSENREIPFGLQERVEELSDLTLASISLAAASGLITLDPVHDRPLVPYTNRHPIQHANQEVKNILAASKRIGHAIAELSFSRLCSILNLKF
ncbi:three component ABC system middle component [Haloferula helveola]|uniref:three component ABC system middle component n=1 Tax=Haloferula helveola TaxID=490095 RepID=UPI0030A1D46F